MSTISETRSVAEPTLSALSEAERYAAYDRLQAAMPDVWAAMRRHLDDESVVVVPSISLERTTATSGTLVQAMEERALFFLLLLRQPRLRMVYVTSLPVSEPVVEYYLGLLPGVIPSPRAGPTHPGQRGRRRSARRSARSCWPGPGCCARSAV